MTQIAQILTAGGSLAMRIERKRRDERREPRDGKREKVKNFKKRHTELLNGEKTRFIWNFNK